MPFPAQDVAQLKDQIIAVLRGRGLFEMSFPWILRCLNLLLRASMDVEVHLGTFAQGVKVGSGTRKDALSCLEDERWSEKQGRQN